ncbi:transforming acidic coiled-coil-containing protein 2 [Anopheles aquasalis]|uniref:transforming acidic coiled-coil-containing protein 2 n=1 Tax=Anopheles aquasalis TaxID=42839 RepID=UPI00215A21B5|nr:transforming acidic coiled-coil-containing protein 2 [Anopheles aquasalis]XP_050086376.1 transforming acidic coiled-coil-containing protein 2 [Anopheles aquasalis]
MGDGMMEVSFEDLSVYDHSAMSVDEGSNSYLLDTDNNNLQQSSTDATGEIVCGQQLMNNVNLSDQKTSSTLIVDEFPKRSEHIVEAGDATRFPLGNTNDQNLPIPTITNMDRVKLHIFDSPKKDVHSSGKENQCGDASNEKFEFPLLTNRGLDDKFPIEPCTLPSKTVDAGNCPLEEEKFTSGNHYNFSAIDFDCLLSRGSSQTAATKSASDTSIVVPRDSVLINFDPLLRRQTIVKADSLLPDDFGPSGDHCVNLSSASEFPSKQEICDSPAKSSYLTPSDSELLLKSNDQVIQRSVVINESGGLPEIDYSASEGLPIPLDEVKQLPSQLLDQSLFESATCPYQPQNVEYSCGSEEQGKKETGSSENRKQLQVNEHSLPATIGTLNQNVLAQLHKNRDEERLQNADNLNRKNDTNAVELLEPDELTVPEVAPPCDLAKQTDFSNCPTDRKEYNELMQLNNMLDISITEKQHKFLNNMSDDHAAHVQDASHEVEKKCKTDENNFADMEKKMQAVDLREESMLKRITEKDKTICKMSNVVEAYERTIAELISEKETLIRTHELECESLKQDNEINAQHLESLEKTFSNLYAKYERMKKNAVEYKEREEKLLNKVLKLEECLRAQEQRYEKMKSHAMSQLEIANTKIDEANRNHSQESAKLKAQIKKEELYRISINEQLIQKSKENEELVKICDELISDTN